MPSSHEIHPEDVARLLTSMLIENCPKDQRNLVKTIGYEYNHQTGGFRVFIGGDALLAYSSAPYAQYTNEREGIHAKETGAPLYKWIERTMEQCKRVVQGG